MLINKNAKQIAAENYLGVFLSVVYLQEHVPRTGSLGVVQQKNILLRVGHTILRTHSKVVLGLQPVQEAKNG